MARRPDYRRVFRLPLFRRTAAAVAEEFDFHLDMRASELVARAGNLTPRTRKPAVSSATSPTHKHSAAALMNGARRRSCAMNI
jgi:hypothetical protein